MIINLRPRSVSTRVFAVEKAPRSVLEVVEKEFRFKITNFGREEGMENEKSK